MSGKSAVKDVRKKAVIGAVFVILCLIGLYNVIAYCYGVTSNILQNTAQKEKFEKMLLPVVMFDPVEFEDPKTYDELAMMQSAIWSVLLGENRDNYQYGDNAQLIIPSSDIDVAAARLFGPDIKINHRSFGDYEVTYLYDEAIKSYHVPIVGLVSFYTPQVTEITKKDGEVILKVAYIAPQSVLDINPSGKSGESEPQKYVTYVLHKGSSDYYIYAIKDQILANGAFDYHEGSTNKYSEYQGVLSDEYWDVPDSQETDNEENENSQTDSDYIAEPSGASASAAD